MFLKLKSLVLLLVGVLLLGVGQPALAKERMNLLL
ncbi:hypothetical protein N752_05670 [Desulforamulus aquiferis]|nr:hypothetical protein N752_05670 [Desulforamulus aquiferis]